MHGKYKKIAVLIFALVIALCEFSVFCVVSYAAGNIVIDKAAYNLSEEIKVNVFGVSKAQMDAGAFVSIYKAGATPDQWMTGKWSYIASLIDDEWKIKAPKEPGNYEMRLYGNKHPDDGNLLGMTPFEAKYFTERNVTVTLNKDIYGVKEEMTVNISGVKPEQVETEIWAGIYKKDAIAKQWMTGKWTYYSKLVSGEWKVNAPNEAGDYELRVYTVNTPVDDAMITTVPFSVGADASASQAAQQTSPPAPVRGGTDALSQGVYIDFDAIPIDTGVLLSWQTVGGASGYLIYRSTEKGAEGVSITDYAITANTYADVNVDTDKTYYYTIKALLTDTGASESPELLDRPPVERAVTTLSAILGGNASEIGDRKKNFIAMKLNDPIMSINGIVQYVDAANPGTTPVERNGRTLMPIRSVIEGMGGTVGWDGETKMITLEAGGHVVVMTLDQKSYTADGVAKEMDIAPGTINDRTMVPVRFAAENVGCAVDWINSTLQIIIVFYT